MDNLISCKGKNVFLNAQIFFDSGLTQRREERKGIVLKISREGAKVAEEKI